MVGKVYTIDGTPAKTLVPPFYKQKLLFDIDVNDVSDLTQKLNENQTLHVSHD